MKKIFILSFIFLFLLFQAPQNISAHFYNNTLDFTVTDNSRYSLTTGIYYTDTDWARTDIQEIISNNIIVDDLYTWDHLLAWDQNDNYLGYYNSSRFNDDLTDTNLGTISNENFYITGDAKKIAFNAHLTTTYEDVDIDTIYGSTSLIEIFGNSNELSNGDFATNLDSWTYSNVTYDSTNHQAALQTNLSNVYLYQNFYSELNAIYYLTFEAYTNQQTTLIIGDNYWGEEADVNFSISLPLTKTRYGYRFQSSYANEDSIQFYDGVFNGHTAYLDNIKIINITAFFGPGNEPSLNTLNTWYNYYLSLPVVEEFISLSDFTNLTVISALWVPNIEETIPNWLKSIGLTEGFGQVILAFILVGGMALLMSLLKAPGMIVILVSLITLFLTIALGLLPSWLLFAIGIIVFIMIILGRNKQ